MIATQTLESVVVGASIEIRKLELLYEKDPTINETGHHNDRLDTMTSMRNKVLDELIKREEDDQGLQNSRD